MSSEALAWAFKQECKSSSAKFTLVALCECANYKTGRIYPSVAHIAEITGQNRKTIIANIAELERLGFVSDTGERMGATRQIKVYQASLGIICSYKKECHYVYRLTNPLTGEFYIGVRSFLGDPDADAYKGSGRWPSGAAYHGIELHKEILAVFDTRNEAEIAEANSIASNIALPLCRNINQESHKRNSIPKTGPLNSPKKVVKQSQKRDTEPSRTLISKANALPISRAKPFQKPDGVEQDVWNDFLDHRKAKRAPLSNTAMAAIEREAAKAGWPLNRALAEIVSRNWQSFKAEWVREKQNGHYANQNDGMGITERAAHRALSEITGGDAGFTGRGSQVPQANASGSYRTIDAMPDAVRSIGYAGG